MGKGMVKWFMLFCLLTFLPLSLSAQVNNNEDEDDDEDEITVTDNKGREEVIEFPEAMTYDLDSLLNLYMSKTYLEEEDCNMRDINPVYSKEEYVSRLLRLPNVMEMVYNDVVQKFIDRYSGRLRHSISYMLGASNFYIPIFEEALEAYQLPLELKYLPIIESALNPKAVSRAGAAGLWQFMIGTGKQYGLQVNSLVDERRDPIKASYAAARYLSDLYKIFGDWNLVIAAYNCGPEIMTYYSLHNICPMGTRLPAKTDTVMVGKNVHLEQVAEVVGINIDLLRSLNPMYRRDIIPGATEPYALRLPLTEVGKFIELQDSVYNYKVDELLNKRSEVEIKDDVPTYYKKSKRSYKRRSARYKSRKSTARKRKSSTRRRSSRARRRR